MVADLATSGVNPPSPFSLPIPARLGDSLYFFAGDGVHGQELWISDGTAAGTSLLLDIDPTGSSRPSGFIVWNGVAYFIADDGVHGTELWWSDGTAGGTFLLRDIAPGERPSSPRYLTIVRGIAYFVADDGVHGAELAALRA